MALCLPHSYPWIPQRILPHITTYKTLLCQFGTSSRIVIKPISSGAAWLMISSWFRKAFKHEHIRIFSAFVWRLIISFGLYYPICLVQEFWWIQVSEDSELKITLICAVHMFVQYIDVCWWIWFGIIKIYELNITSYDIWYITISLSNMFSIRRSLICAFRLRDPSDPKILIHRF